MPELSIQEIAEICKGEITGDKNLTVYCALGLDGSVEGSVTFAGDKKSLETLKETKASAAIVPAGTVGDFPCALISAENPRVSFVLVAQKLAPAIPRPAAGVHPTAYVAEDAEIAEGVSIGPKAVIESGAKVGTNTIINAGCYIGQGTTIGSDCMLYPNVTVYYGCTLGNKIVIHSGAVIGADGFGFQWDGKEHLKIPQVGNVVIKDNVEIGANATIDRARFGTTLIGEGCKFDNLTHVAHNCNIGENCVFAGLVGISGSVTTGHNVVVGGQVGFADHITIGSNCHFYAKSGVTGDVPDGSIYAGQPAKDIRTALKEYHNMRSIGDIKKKIKEIEKKLEQE